MVDLLTFFRGTLGHEVPQEATGWLREHVDPEWALARAHAVHLLWLSSLCEGQTSQEIVEVCFARIAARSSYVETQREPQGPGASAALAQASERLRAALQGSGWWAGLVERWEARQSRGLGVVRYRLHGLDVEAVRGTQVGRFAVRELRWADGAPVVGPPLRYREETPRCRQHEVRPEWLYAIDLVETGQSLGSYASAAVAFEVADRFDRRGVISRPIPAALQRVLDEYRGYPPQPHARSWPAEPHWSFAECRRRVLGRGGGLGGELRSGEAGRIEAGDLVGKEVGHAV